MDDNSDGVFDVQASGVTAQTHTQTGVIGGNSYKFRVKARNAVDFGIYSDVKTIVAATVPSQPVAPTTTNAVVDSVDVVTVSWSEPSDNGGLTITGYILEVKGTDNQFHKDTINCDAETNTTIINSRSCNIPVSVLTTTPFSLATSASVIARVAAENDLGTSVASSEGSGATIPTP